MLLKRKRISRQPVTDQCEQNNAHTTDNANDDRSEYETLYFPNASKGPATPSGNPLLPPNQDNSHGPKGFIGNDFSKGI